jgi:hypothetical protein
MEPAPGDDHRQAEQATLRDLCREFPQFAVWCEVMPGRTRVNAQRIGFAPGLHSVITVEVDELRATLTRARAANLPPRRPACLPGTGTATSAAARRPSS